MFMLGDTAYSREEILELYRSGDHDISTRLILQLTATFLNILSGAEIHVIEGTLVDANNWLATHPKGTSPSEFNRRRGFDLIALLEGYNNGIFGPGACADVPPTPDLTASAMPSHTSTPQEQILVETIVVPASPTQPPPVAPTVPPTNPPAEDPTDTPLPTATEPPPPTSTQPAPPPTQAPTPTQALVLPSPTLAPTPTQALGDLPLPTLAPTQGPNLAPEP
jgi:hypothetical protein